MIKETFIWFCFEQGSLGFLTPFKFTNFEDQINKVLEGKTNTQFEKKSMIVYLVGWNIYILKHISNV